MPEIIRVAIVEDDPLLRTHLARVIGDSNDMEVAWLAGSVADAKKALDEIPDVALVDLGLPDGNGAEIVQLMSDEHDTKILVITVFDERGSVVKAINSGADGYLVKDSTASEILRAIRALMDGGSPISAAAAIHLVDIVRNDPSGGREYDATPSDVRLLTPREIEMLELFAKGLTYAQVAEIAGISRHTVGDHMKSIFRKLSVQTRSEAIFEAVQNKLIKL